MTATITDLNKWKASHPPILRLWDVQYRVVAAWWSLALSPWWITRK